ncbi:MAG: 4,5-DOPA-extradiol-dioxygenase [Caulobacteraceae bacterium]
MTPALNRAPALFIGHGSPTNAIEDNAFSQLWRELGARIGKPRAILAVSAHWETKGVLVTAAERPRTIHDFYGFPQALFDVAYDCPGDPALARDIARRLAAHGARADLDGWGVDHGTWSVLRHLVPDADIPTLQISLDVRRTPEQHYQLARELRSLRDEGVLILGSGDIVHNLRLLDWKNPEPPQWARDFDDRIIAAVRAGDHAAVLDWRSLPDAALAVPEAEHLLPLFYVLGAAFEDETPEVFEAGHFSTVSMTSVGYGLT